MFACIYAPGLPASQHKALVDCAYSFTPRLEETAPDTVLLDMEGCGHLFGSSEEMGARISRHAAELGLAACPNRASPTRASVALAANPDAAACAARGFPGVTVIPPGEEARVLGSLPVDALFVVAPVPPKRDRYIAGKAVLQHENDAGAGESQEFEELAETLRSWGIRTCGELGALPEEALSERLGQQGVYFRKLALGQAKRPLVPSIPPRGFEKSAELEYPVALLEPLTFILASLLNQLCRNLEERALATNELRLRLKLEEQREHERDSGEPESGERVLRLPFPMRDNKALLRLLQLDLEMHPPQAPVIGVALRAKPVKPRVIQEGLFLPLAPEPQKLELTLARIANMVGQENAGWAELLDTHRPDAFRMKKFAPPAIAGTGKNAGKNACPHCAPWGRPFLPVPSPTSPGGTGQNACLHCAGLAFRRFRPARPAEIACAEGRPARIKARGVHGKVLSLAGPWRASGDWWSPGGWIRDEWDVALSDGALYRISLDRHSKSWFVDGSYD